MEDWEQLQGVQREGAGCGQTPEEGGLRDAGAVPARGLGVHAVLHLLKISWDGRGEAEGPAESSIGGNMCDS